jgi:TetR/AcrR family transcriptional repressor of nem operon
VEVSGAARVSDDARTRILDTALRSIHRASYESVGVSAIAAEADVPKGSFYHWFSSKEDLAVAVVDTFALKGGALRREMFVADGRPALDRLAAYFRHVIAVHERENFRRGCLLGNLALEVSGQSEKIRERVAQALDRWEKTMRALLEEAYTNGEMPPGLSPEDAAAFILNAWEGALLRMKVAHTARPLKLFMWIVFEHLLQVRSGTMPVRKKRPWRGALRK